MTFRKVWAIIDKYPGHFWPDEAEEMYNQLLKLDEKSKVVELGCFHGRSSTVIGEASQIVGFKFWCVDNFSIDGEDAEKNFRKYILDRYKNCILLKESTDSAAARWKPEYEIDYLHIDANHQNEGITADCENWLGFVKSGGVVQFHDYVNKVAFPQLPDIVDTYTEGWKIMEKVDLSCFKRKP